MGTAVFVMRHLFICIYVYLFYRGAIFSSKLVELELLADDLDAATNMLQVMLECKNSVNPFHYHYVLCR